MQKGVHLGHHKGLRLGTADISAIGDSYYGGGDVIQHQQVAHLSAGHTLTMMKMTSML